MRQIPTLGYPQAPIRRFDHREVSPITGIQFPPPKRHRGISAFLIALECAILIVLFSIASHHGERLHHVLHETPCPTCLTAHASEQSQAPGSSGALTAQY